MFSSFMQIVRTALRPSSASGSAIRLMNGPSHLRKSFATSTASTSPSSPAPAPESLSLMDIAMKEAEKNQTVQAATTTATSKKNLRTFTFSSPNYRISPWKSNLVAKVIRNLALPEALKQMQFSKKRAGLKLFNLLKRCRATLVNDHLSVGEGWRIKECYVGKGTYLRRLLIQGRGRTGMMHHPSSHFKVIVEELPEGIVGESAGDKKLRVEFEKLRHNLRRHKLYVQLPENRLPFNLPPPWDRRAYKYITSPRWLNPKSKQ
ncbi:54S ribosomal protein L22, mitochondrial [Phlyctochytrium planicorne]|nr:54S ribosomal protein L22, mitochondrial [Phlyctochytrium planicorne]